MLRPADLAALAELLVDAVNFFVPSSLAFNARSRFVCLSINACNSFVDSFSCTFKNSILLSSLNISPNAPGLSSD